MGPESIAHLLRAGSVLRRAAGEFVLIVFGVLVALGVKDIRFRESATPLDPETVMRDPYLLNIIEYRLAVLRANPVAATASAITRVQTTLSRLDTTLSQMR